MAEEDQKPNKENPDEAAPVESAPDEAAPDEAAASPDMTTESVEEEAAEVPMGKGVKIFKIFTGPHQGGEFDLGDQAYSLGKNEDADIVFSDMDLSDNHAKIAVRGDEFIVTPDQGKVFLEGQELPPGEHVIPPYTMVTMGATNLAFGYSEDHWPVLTIPSFLKGQGEETPGTEGAVGTEEQSKSEEMPAEELGRFAAFKVFFSREKWADLVERGRKKAKENPLLAALVSVGVAVILLGLILLIFTDITDTRPAIDDLQKAYMQQANRVIEQQGLTGHVVANGPIDGHIILRGYVATLGDKERLLNAFDVLDIAVDPELHIASQIEESARIVLGALGYDLKIQMVEDGILLVQGVVDSEAPVMNMLLKLKNDVAGIERVDDRIIAMDTLGRDLSQISNEYGLLGLVSFEILGRQINVTGNVYEDLVSQYKKMISAIKTRVMNEFQVLSKIEISKEEEDIIIGDGDIEEVVEDISKLLSGVWLGRKPYIVFKDKTRYYADEVLPDGAKILEITRNDIILLKDSTTFSYNFRKHAQWIVEPAG